MGRTTMDNVMNLRWAIVHIPGLDCRTTMDDVMNLRFSIV